jgi:hypothetical protein
MLLLVSSGNVITCLDVLMTVIEREEELDVDSRACLHYLLCMCYLLNGQLDESRDQWEQALTLPRPFRLAGPLQALGLVLGGARVAEGDRRGELAV